MVSSSSGRSRSWSDCVSSQSSSSREVLKVTHDDAIESNRRLELFRAQIGTSKYAKLHGISSNKIDKNLKKQSKIELCSLGTVAVTGSPKPHIQMPTAGVVDDGAPRQSASAVEVCP